MTRTFALACVLASPLACNAPDDPASADDASSGGQGSSGDGSGSPDPTTQGEGSTEAPDPTNATGVTATTGDGTTSGSSAETSADTGDETTGADATTGDDTTGDDTASTTDDGTTGGVVDGPSLPTPSMPCPELVDGVVDIHPEGVAAARPVRIWVDPDAATELDGPVVFYWHGTGGMPEEAQVGLGKAGIQEIVEAGGIVVAATHDPGAGAFPWHLVLGQKEDDLLVADEVLACAQEQFGVDAARIHSLGFSAGALHTAQMSIRRSSYLASVTLYSGGLIFNAMPPYQDPDNKFSAMIFHGGQQDVVVVGFEQASEDYSAYLAAHDQFSFICDHGQGHTIPDATDSVMQFFYDHPWGTVPSPYVEDLPPGFPAYCALP